MKGVLVWKKLGLPTRLFINRVIALLSVVAAVALHGNAVAGTMTVATGGGAISADTTSAAGGTGAWTSLTGPSYLETVKADLLSGTVILTAPAGFEFNTAATVTVRLTAGDPNANKNINSTPVGGTVATATVTATTITWTIASQSSGNTMDQLTWLGIQVRPTAGTPLATGNIIPSGTSGIGGFAASAGTLTEVAGAANKLAFVQQPSNAVAGVAISPAMTVAIQDRFGNTVTSNTSTVTLAIGINPGGGTLSGTASVAAVAGVATFNTLSINKTGVGYTLTASDGALTGITSGAFNITPGAVSAAVSTVAASPASLPADGTTTSTVTVTLKDALGNAVPGKTVTLTAGSGSSTISVASGPSNASGVVTFTVKDTVVEAVIYTAKDTTDNVTITQTATVTFTVVVSSFNAFESTTAAGATTGVIKTRIAGSAFSLDVVAISGGAQSAGFTNVVKVELLGNTVTGIALDAQNCPTSSTLLQTVTPNPTITGGRSTVNFASVADAWKDVRVRISYPAAAPTIIFCSTDNFAIRPNSLSVSLTDTDWQSAGIARALNNSGASGGNVHKAAQPFTIQATAYNAAAAITGSYAGSPTVGTLACTLPTPLCANGTLTPGAWSASGGTVTTTIASYSEAGAFNLTLEDRTFASVDSADGTPANCTASGYYVCSVAVSVGRFVPDHFDVTTPNTPTFKTFDAADAACSAGAAPRRTFTYIGQPFGYLTAPQAIIRARNAAGTTTVNYQGTGVGGLWKVAASDITQTYSNNAVGPALDTTLIGTPTVTDNSNGTGTVAAAAAGTLAYQRSTAAPIARFTAKITLTISARDATENVANQGIITSTTTALFDGGGTGIAFDSVSSPGVYEFRYGRLKLSNAYGSELLALPIRMETQYWDAAIPAFVTNSADNCTNLTAANITLGSYQYNGGVVWTSGISFTGPFSAGFGNLKLTKPSPTPTSRGSVDVTVNLTAESKTYLQGAWTGATYTQNPTSRATFGVYKGANEFIYLRENY